MFYWQCLSWSLYKINQWNHPLSCVFFSTRKIYPMIFLQVLNICHFCLISKSDSDNFLIKLYYIGEEEKDYITEFHKLVSTLTEEMEFTFRVKDQKFHISDPPYEAPIFSYFWVTELLFMTYYLWVTIVTIYEYICIFNYIFEIT